MPSAGIISDVNRQRNYSPSFGEFDGESRTKQKKDYCLGNLSHLRCTFGSRFVNARLVIACISASDSCPDVRVENRAYP